MTSESPAIQSRSFLLGENAGFFGGLGVVGVGVGFGFGFGVLTGDVGVAGCSGSAISVSISSASERPTTAWTPFRGRSRRSSATR